MGVSEVITRKVGMNLATKIILLLVATLSFSAVLAMQPITVPMEIRNSTGGIANDTSFDINFTFYDRPTGGVLLFNQTQTLTTDRFGRIFAIVNTTGFNGTAPVWLELNVSNITMSPRMQLTAALFAINSERLQNQTRTGGLTLGNISLQGNLSHTVGGLLINRTGGINASAVGFGTIPQGVLDAARFWTAAHVFVNTNFTGPVNVTSNTDTLGTSIFAVRNQSGAALFRVGLDTTGRSAINFMAASIFNITMHNSGAFVIRKDAEPILDISYPTGSGSIVSVASTFNITNLTARGPGPTAVLLINDTGGINASAVGFGSIPQGVLDLARIWTTAQNFTRAYAGNITLSGELNHTVAGTLINTTGGINASSVGFGTLPSGVLPGSVPQTTITNNWTTGQRFENVNVSGMVNVTLGATGTKPLVVYHSDGVERFSVETGNTQINLASEVNITQTGIPALAVRSGTGTLYFIVNTFSGNTSAFGIFHAVNNAFLGNATLKANGILNHSTGGLLVNETGGINASAVGFGSIPLGVFGNLLAGINTWTAGQIFGQGLNTSYINVTGTAADTADLFVVRGVVGNVLFRISNTGYITTNGGTLSVRNLTANNQADAVLINTTGAINASAIGQITSGGLLQKSVIPVYANGTATPHIQGGLIQFGNAIIPSQTDVANAEGRVNMSIAYSCQWCYSVAVNSINATAAGEFGTVRIRSFNASSFDVLITVKGGMNISWIAVGY